MSSDESAPKKQRAGWVNALIGVVIGLALGLTIGAAMTMWRVYEAHGVLERTQADHAAVLATRDTEMAALQSQIDALQSAASGMEARISVCRAVTELDSRNFGTAQSEIESARTAVANAPEDVQAAAASLGEVDLRVAVDAGSQRQVLLGVGRAMDTAIRD